MKQTRDKNQVRILEAERQHKQNPRTGGGSGMQWRRFTRQLALHPQAKINCFQGLGEEIPRVPANASAIITGAHDWFNLGDGASATVNLFPVNTP